MTRPTSRAKSAGTSPSIPRATMIKATVSTTVTTTTRMKLASLSWVTSTSSLIWCCDRAPRRRQRDQHHGGGDQRQCAARRSRNRDATGSADAAASRKAARRRSRWPPSRRTSPPAGCHALGSSDGVSDSIKDQRPGQARGRKSGKVPPGARELPPARAAGGFGDRVRLRCAPWPGNRRPAGCLLIWRARWHLVARHRPEWPAQFPVHIRALSPCAVVVGSVPLPGRVRIVCDG